MSGYDVLIFGSYFCDLIVTGLPELPRLGADLFGTGMGIHAGGAFNTVRALHRLGVKVGWVCDLGNDLFSQYVISEIRSEGVDESLLRIHDYSLRSFSLSFSFCEDRGFISYIDPPEPFDPTPYILEHRPKSLMIGHLLYGEEVMASLAAAREVGAKVLMDCQDASISLDSAGVIEALRSVDVFMPNAAEALGLTAADTVEDAACRLAEYAPLAVVKMGADGVVAVRQGRKTCVPALPVEVVDTTGAGDCFNAGFIYGYLQDKALQTCLRYGCICGSLSTTAHGSVAAPNEEELLKYDRQFPE